MTERDFIGYGPDQPRITWPGGARIAISLVVNFEEGSERSPLYGDASAEPGGEGYAVPPGVRDLRAESWFDYGTRAGFWRLQRMLRRCGVPATYFLCAQALERVPEAAEAIMRDGHEPACHGYRWLPIFDLGRDEERRHLRLAVETIRRLTGERPLGWYSRGESPHTKDLLLEEGGFVYNCDSYAEDLPYFIRHRGQRMLMLPYSLETNDIKFYRPPGMSAPGDFFRWLKASFDCLYDEGLTHPKMMSVGIHMRLAGRPGRAEALERFIRYAQGHPDVWFARRIDIARWWLQHYAHLTTAGEAASPAA